MLGSVEVSRSKLLKLHTVWKYASICKSHCLLPLSMLAALDLIVVLDETLGDQSDYSSSWGESGVGDETPIWPSARRFIFSCTEETFFFLLPTLWRRKVAAWNHLHNQSHSEVAQRLQSFCRAANGPCTVCPKTNSFELKNKKINKITMVTNPTNQHSFAHSTMHALPLMIGGNITKPLGVACGT